MDGPHRWTGQFCVYKKKDNLLPRSGFEPGPPVLIFLCYTCFLNIASSAIRAFHEREYAIIRDEWLNTLCIMRTFTYACSLLRDFSDHCQHTWMDNRPDFSVSDMTLFLLRDLLQREESKETASAIVNLQLKVTSSVFTFHIHNVHPKQQPSRYLYEL